MTSNIPKFTSFRPKSKPKLDDDSPHAKLDLNDAVPSYHKNENTSEAGPRSAKQPTSDKTCFADRKGDPEILRYGSVSRYDVPEYHRYGYGRVLGLPKDEKIDQERTTARIITIITTERRQCRPLTQKGLLLPNDRQLRLLKMEKQNIPVDHDYIPVSSLTARHDVEDDEYDDTTMPDYRNIRQCDVGQHLDPDTYLPDIIPWTDSEVVSQNAQFLRATREHPDNLQAWLSLIKHQEAMVKLDRHTIDLSPSDRVHLADIRIAMFEEALRKVDSNLQSHIELCKGLLESAQDVWDATKLTVRWKTVLAKHPNDVGLWLQYMDFIQSSFTGFKYDSCRLGFMNIAQQMSVKTELASEDVCIHILLRLTSMIHDAGYQELALAIWQATLEFHLMRTEEISKSSIEEQLNQFETFWESEVPRIGEPKAKGWRNAKPDEIPPPGPVTSFGKQISQNTLDKLFTLESTATTSCRYPGRASDDEDRDDAFHVIFYSDIMGFLRLMPPQTSSTLYIAGFLQFCQMPPLAIVSSQNRWRTDPFLHRHFQQLNTTSNNDREPGGLIERHDSPVTYLQMSSELLLEQSFSTNGSRLDTSFIRRSLKVLASLDTVDDSIGEYLLAFEAHHFPNDVHKTAKHLLKTRSSSYRLYATYGLIQSSQNNAVKADQIFSMALSMQKGSAHEPIIGSLELTKCWTWEALRQKLPTEALWRLIAIDVKTSLPPAPRVVPSQSVIERARTVLSKVIESNLLDQNLHSAVLGNSLQMLLIYLASNFDIHNATTAHQSLTSWFTSHRLSTSPYAELHAQNLTRLLRYHMIHAPIVPPSLIRDTLSPLLSHFPNNTIMLTLFAMNESRFVVEDRVRGIMRDLMLQDPGKKNVAGWAFAIQHEKQRKGNAGSTVHSVRAVYKRAVESRCANSPALWKSYLEFEYEQLERERAIWSNGSLRKGKGKGEQGNRMKNAEQRVKETFYNGLKRLPWCKEYIMMAFMEGLSVFEKQELSRLYRVMQENELRLYIDIDE